MKYWRYIIHNVVINLHDNDSEGKTFNQTHCSQFWLVNYFHKESNQLQFLTSVYAGYFVICIRPFQMGGALEKPLDLPCPYPTIACFSIRPLNLTHRQTIALQKNDNSGLKGPDLKRDYDQIKRLFSQTLLIKYLSVVGNIHRSDRDEIWLPRSQDIDGSKVGILTSAILDHVPVSLQYYNSGSLWEVHCDVIFSTRSRRSFVVCPENVVRGLLLRISIITKQWFRKLSSCSVWGQHRRVLWRGIHSLWRGFGGRRERGRSRTTLGGVGHRNRGRTDSLESLWKMLKIRIRTLFKKYGWWSD